MKITDLFLVESNISLKDYYYLYNYVRDNMIHPEWLGYIPEEETKYILDNGGKIWLYYYNDKPVCSMMYIPSNSKSLLKHNINTDEKETGSLGPIMVHPEYVGNGFMNQMLEIFEKYNRSIGNNYIFTKAVKDNIYSISVLEKNGYIVTDKYKNERGINLSFIKNIK